MNFLWEKEHGQCGLKTEQTLQEMTFTMMVQEVSKDKVFIHLYSFKPKIQANTLDFISKTLMLNPQ